MRSRTLQRAFGNPFRYFNPDDDAPSKAAPKPFFKKLKGGSGVDGDLIKSAIWGMAGFYGNSIMVQFAEKVPIASTFGPLATNLASVLTIMLGSRWLTDSKDTQRALLLGAIINAGLSLVGQYTGLRAQIAGATDAGPYESRSQFHDTSTGSYVYGEQSYQ